MVQILSSIVLNPDISGFLCGSILRNDLNHPPHFRVGDSIVQRALTLASRLRRRINESKTVDLGSEVDQFQTNHVPDSYNFCWHKSHETSDDQRTAGQRTRAC